MGVAVTIILFWRYGQEHVKYRKRNMYTESKKKSGEG
jgi:hypothetical protein